MVQFNNLNNEMETRDHSKNGASLKSQMSKGIFFRKVCVAVLVASFIFSGCSKDDNNNSGGSQTDAENVSGTIVGEYADWDEVGATFDYGNTWAKKVPISNGKFNLSLPAPDENDLEDSDYNDFFYELAVGSVKFKYTYADFFALKNSQKGSRTLELSGNSSKGKFMVTRLYVDKNVDIVGFLGNTTMDLKLKKGWNVVLYYQKEQNDGSTKYSYTTGSVPIEANWK